MHCVVCGGWVGRSVRGSLFLSCGRSTFCFVSQNTGLPLVVLGSTTVLTAALLCPLLQPYVLLHCRTAALSLFCFFSTYVQRINPLLLYVLLHCRTALLFFWYFSTYIESTERMIQHQFICFVRHTCRQQAYFGSTTRTQCIFARPVRRLFQRGFPRSLLHRLGKSTRLSEMSVVIASVNHLQFNQQQPLRRTKAGHSRPILAYGTALMFLL